MLNTARKYSAKVLLFGEYTVIQGSQALAAPYAAYWGCWSDHPEWEEHLERGRYHSHRLRSRDAMQDVFNYLQQQQANEQLSTDWDLAKLNYEKKQGLWFYSRIPTGYGLGSSGAFSCALLQRYTDFNFTSKETTLPELRNLLAEVESCFHGESSGLDPLVSYLSEPVLIRDGVAYQTRLPQLTENGGGIFLLNTRRARQTGPLVDLYLEKCRSFSFREGCVHQLAVHNNRAIDAMLQGKRRDCLAATRMISTFQRQHFEEMIPEDYRAIWDRGLESGIFTLKLCGAGGGGFLLGFTGNWLATQSLLGREDIELFMEW